MMSAKRENCVLVAEDDGGLLGIFTAKDLAFRVVGMNLNSSTVTIDQIMTSNPVCARSDTLASDALNLMVTKGFRHLPVLDDNDEIFGVLDITKCYHEAMEKLDRVLAKSKKLQSALNAVKNEVGQQQPEQIVHYFDNLKSLMDAPTVGSILDGTPPVFVSPKTNVLEAATLMRENRTTAVLVQDQDEITGIFTSKDVVLRVISAGLDPKLCRVVRVMTPQPDVAPKNLSVQSALRKMNDGHYLNLPVVDDDGQIMGIVEVLKLTYAILDQIKTIKTTDGSDDPMWNKFWSSIDNDTESTISESRGDPSIVASSAPDVSQAELSHFELGPNDSVSYIDQSASFIDKSYTGVPVEEIPFPFKFKAPSGRVHRVTLAPGVGVDALRNAIARKLAKTELKVIGGSKFAISFIDDEGDVVAITSDHDLIDAAILSRKVNSGKIELILHHPEEDPELTASVVGSRKSDSIRGNGNGRNNNKNSNVIDGIPNEYLLPGAVTILAVSILIVFAFSHKR